MDGPYSHTDSLDEQKAAMPGAPWVLGVTGASGIRYALKLIDELSNSKRELHVVFSEAALRVLQEEEGIKLSSSTFSVQALIGEERKGIHFYSPKDIGAKIASGSFLTAGMVIIPCSMGTLGAVASGLSTNLVQRAADVALKEGRKLILVPRETPLSAIHLENMLKLSKLGVGIVPAMPGFYHRPTTLEHLVDMMVMKVLDAMGVPSNLVTRWKDEASPQVHPEIMRPGPGRVTQGRLLAVSE